MCGGHGFKVAKLLEIKTILCFGRSGICVEATTSVSMRTASISKSDLSHNCGARAELRRWPRSAGDLFQRDLIE